MTERGQGNRWLPGIALCLGTISIAACQKTPDTPPPPAASSSSAAAPAPAQAYVPPTAEQLYQLVAPIALFPDKLVAQTLAASAYPDQVTAAQAWMQQNRQLAPAALIDAANAQPWDPSVKSLTAFPNVVDQLARNVDWTTALGDAYVNDPTDVLNAIQVMRQRAQSHGNLASTPQQKVAVRDRSGDDVSVFDGDPGPVVYSGPAVVPAPQRTIVIEPEQDNVVYVPSYDPGVVYGDDVTIYRGYDYRPAPRYSTGQVVATGLVSFGVGVLVGEALSHHDHRDWGWHAWNMNWGGGPDRGPGRPAVVYNDRPYVSHSTTVINRVTNNTTINRIDNRHDFGNDNRNITVNRGPAAAPGNPAFQAQAQQRPGPGARPAPDFEHMQRPSFTDRMTRPGQPVPAQPQERPEARERAAQAGMAAAPGQPPRMPDPRMQEQQRDQQVRAQQQQAQQQERQQQERGRQQQDQQREQARGQEQQQQQREQQERAQQQQRVQQDQQHAQQQDRMQQGRAQQQQRSQQQDQQRAQQQERAQQEQRAQQQDRAQQQQRAQQQDQQRGQQQQERAEMAAREQQHREQPRPQPAQRPQPEHHDVPHPHKDEKKDDHN